MGALSKLQRLFGDMLYAKFPEYHIMENYRPEWMLSSGLTRLELDFYIEELKTAFEVQGDQHFRYVEYFHGCVENFENMKIRDAEKVDLCYGKGVKLIYICTELDAIIAIKTIEENREQERKESFHTLASKYRADKEYEKIAKKESLLLRGPKQTERSRFRDFAKRRIKEHKRLDISTFKFVVLTKEQQIELIKEMEERWSAVSSLPR